MLIVLQSHRDCFVGARFVAEPQGEPGSLQVWVSKCATQGHSYMELRQELPGDCLSIYLSIYRILCPSIYLSITNTTDLYQNRYVPPSRDRTAASVQDFLTQSESISDGLRLLCEDLCGFRIPNPEAQVPKYDGIRSQNHCRCICIAGHSRKGSMLP